METVNSKRVWVGIDWGDTAHAVSVLDENGSIAQQFRIPNNPAGFEELGSHLARHEEVRGIAMESTRNTLLLFLVTQGHPLYLINPKQSKAWRDGDALSGAKSDARDGLCLARGLAFRHNELRPLRSSDPEMARLALLCEKECDLIHQRTALVQELKSSLKLYYPAALTFFDSWSCPTAWDFLRRFPTAQKLSNAREHTVIAFLQGHNVGYSARWKQRVQQRTHATQWPKHPQEDVYAMHTAGLVAQLKGLHETLKNFRREIAAAFATLPQTTALNSLPGAGVKLQPRLASIVLSSLAQEGGLEAIRGHAGVAPVTKESGKSRHVHIRRMCNKHWRNTLHLFAFCSTRKSPWAKAYYDYRRGKGDTHSTALRKLADKWLRIILRMLATGEHYDEQKHLTRLKEKGSPLWDFVQARTCG